MNSAPQKVGWLQRLRAGLSRSSAKLTDGIAGIFTTRRLDEAALEELEELLITADLGVATAAKLTARLGKEKFDKEVSPEEVRTSLAEDIAEILTPVARPLEARAQERPHVILIVGVNGSGKTTTIGKLAHRKAPRDLDRRGQRQRQNDHHRQARPPLWRRGSQGHAGGGRYLPCGGHRPA
jgi:fused signal recognition particle receptor